VIKKKFQVSFISIYLSNSKSLAVDLITNDKVIIDKNYNLIMQARYFLAKDWDIQVIHVYREANSAADWLANYSLTRSCFDRFSNSLNDPPVGLYYNLYYDLIGSTLPRLI
jgi:hypothetical protein